MRCHTGQLPPPPPWLTKNDHFLKLCQEGQLRPRKWRKSVTKNDHFCVKKASWETPVSDKKVCVKRKENFL